MNDPINSSTLSVEEAWTWYDKARSQLRLFSKLGEKYWDGLPWDGPMGRDEAFQSLESQTIVQDTRAALKELDDFAVVVLYSSFETAVRDRVRVELTVPRDEPLHGLLAVVVDSAIARLEKDPSSRVLELLKTRVGSTIFRDVSQVREYRNWVAHGRRGTKPFTLDPRAAYARLSTFLVQMTPDPDASPSATPPPEKA